jgi:hypothetical protein
VPAKTEGEKKRDEALEELRAIKDALLTVQATVGSYVRRADRVIEMLEPKKAPEPLPEPPPEDALTGEPSTDPPPEKPKRKRAKKGT